MSQPTLEELHADPAHWKLGIFYFCREDRRVLVPKRIQGLGWAVNFARPSAVVWIAAIILFAWGTVTLARYAGLTHEALVPLKIVLAFGIIIFCHRAANASTARK